MLSINESTIEHIIDNKYNQLQVVKTDSYYLRKSIKNLKRDICEIKRQSRPIKVKFKKFNTTHIIRNDLNKINKKAHAVKCELHDAKNSLEKHRKEICDNKKSIRSLYNDIFEVKIGLCFARNAFDNIINKK